MAWHQTWNEPPRRSGFFSDRGFLPPGVKIILLITVGVYLLDALVFRGRLTEIGALTVRGLLRFELWQLVTYMFLHSLSSVSHILWNMFIFAMLGITLERQVGTKQFLGLYLIGGVVGGLSEVIFNLLMHWQYGHLFVSGGRVLTFLDIPAVGASGGVMCILMAFAVLNPRAVFLLFFLLPVQARWVALVYFLAETRHILLGLQHGWADGVAHAAHFGGMVLGYVWVKFGGSLARWRRRRQGLAGYRYTLPGPARDPEDQAEVDRILRKVHDGGIDSLTQQEKLFLQESARRRDR